MLYVSNPCDFISEPSIHPSHHLFSLFKLQTSDPFSQTGSISSSPLSQSACGGACVTCDFGLWRGETRRDETTRRHSTRGGRPEVSLLLLDASLPLLMHAIQLTCPCLTPCSRLLSCKARQRTAWAEVMLSISPAGRRWVFYLLNASLSSSQRRNKIQKDQTLTMLLRHSLDLRDVRPLPYAICKIQLIWCSTQQTFSFLQIYCRWGCCQGVQPN
jgi:hypothetical protein